MQLRFTVFLAMVVWCSCDLFAQTVKVNWLAKAPFADYKSYAWKPSTSQASDFFTQFVKPDVDAQMSGKGLHKEEAGQKPDLFVTYHVQTQEAADAKTTADGFDVGEESWGASDCWDGCGWGEHNDRTPTTHGAAPRNMAILTVDLADAGTNKLVWRAQAAVDSVSPTQKGDEKQVEHAVQRMFKKYPPK
jgi:hypothetical protein